MSSSTCLQRWVQAQYQILGVDNKGHFIGKKRFKDRLIDAYNASNGGKVPKLEIRQLVNRYDLCLSSQPQRPHPY